jgi:hypothetical protein
MQNRKLHKFIIITIIVPLAHDSVDSSSKRLGRRLVLVLPILLQIGLHGWQLISLREIRVVAASRLIWGSLTLAAAYVCRELHTPSRRPGFGHGSAARRSTEPDTHSAYG